jgi:hypothetical protein
VWATLTDLPHPRDQAPREDLTRWRTAFLAYWTTGHANNGLIELDRHIAHGILNPRPLPATHGAHRRLTRDCKNKVDSPADSATTT